MNCASFETLLSDYADETLDERVREAVDSHLATCPACTRLLRDVRSVRSLLTDFPQAAPSMQLLETVIERTSGRFHVRSLWRDLVIPTVRPFLSQRFAFATLIMFVFVSLMVNMIGPDFSALSASDFRPSALVEQADRASSQVYKKWMQLRNFRSRFVGELWRLKEDVYGRLDYYLISLLFRSYQGHAENGNPEEAPRGEKKP